MSQVKLLMNKKICSILIVTLTFFTACKQSVKLDKAAKKGNDKIEAVSMVNHGDSLLHADSTAGSKKLSCCVSPPSRSKIKVDKK